MNFAPEGTEVAIVYPEVFIFPAVPSAITIYPEVGVAEKLGKGIQLDQEEALY
ncbi:MAG: hypothetical protein ACI4VL_00250 [Bacilli bacterium]